MRTDILTPSLRDVLCSLREQLRGSTAFVLEALRNAYRANATSVWVEWDGPAGVMLFRDDGTAIDNIAPLFTRGHAGWEAGIFDREASYGVDFLTIVLASEHVSIRTGNCNVEIDTHDPLHSLHMKMRGNTGSVIEGTELRLKLNPDLEPLPRIAVEGLERSDYWQIHFERVVLGFPIPVYFNGVKLPRPHALDSGLEFFSTEIGQFHVQGLSACKMPGQRGRPFLYCHGLPVAQSMYWGAHSKDVLHLDPKRFYARMPDRAALVDETHALRRIQAMRDDWWRKRLTERRSQILPQEFAEAYWHSCREWDMEELLRDVPIARSMLQRYISPVDAVDLAPDHVGPWEGEIPGRDALFIERVDLNYAGIEIDPPAPLASIYAIARKVPVLVSKVPDSHWVRGRVADLLDEELRLSYELHGTTHSADFNRKYMECEVKCCESYTISFFPTASCAVPADVQALLTPITIRDQPFYDPLANRIVVPAGAEEVGSVVGQVYSYVDDDGRYIEGEYEKDSQALQELVTRLRANSP